MTLGERAGGKTDLVAMVQHSNCSQSINTYCNHTVSYRIDTNVHNFVYALRGHNWVHEPFHLEGANTQIKS